MNIKSVQREILVSLWKIHILHHAGQGEVVGQWMIEELRHHGYQVSPGTLYPILRRMESFGWLQSTQDPTGGPHARRRYTLTPQGREVLDCVLKQVAELKQEVLPKSKDP